MSDLATAFRSFRVMATSMFWNEWALYQVVLILLGLVVALLARRRLEPPLEAWARGIKGNPDLLRLVIALMRRLHWLTFVVYLFVLRLVLLAAGAPQAVVANVLMLSAAWLVLAVATRLIRNRLLARAVALLAWIYVGLLVFGLLPTAAAALDYNAVSVGDIRISALTVVKTLLITGGVLWLALFVSRLVESQIDRAEDISPSLKILLGKAVRIFLVLVAGAFALSATGIDLTALTVLSGAVGVGIGFGLQKVVSNFVSGIIILLDRSVKPGDTIALGETFGWIQELRGRFVSVVTRDGRKYLIPNEDFITQQVINWSYSDHYIRLDVPFGVAYASDPHKVTELAIAAARSVQRVSTYREPVCWLTAFGESSLDFTLRFWIVDPREGLTNVRGQVLMALWDSFKAEGVEIPFPQRDVAIKGPIEMAVRRHAGKDEPQ